MGVVDHEQLALAEGRSRLGQPGGETHMQLRAPALWPRRPRDQGVQLQPQGLTQRGASREFQRSVAHQRDPLKPPVLAIPEHPLNRQGVQDFMGEHHPGEGRLLELGEGLPPAAQGSISQERPLTLRHARVRFHQHQFQALAQLWCIPRNGLRELEGELAFPWAGLDQGPGAVAWLVLEPLQKLRQQELGEVRSQGRGGGEVTRRPHLQASRPIGPMAGIVQRPVHVGAEGHPATGGLQPLHQPGGGRVQRR